jgi:hypothetical protein
VFIEDKKSQNRRPEAKSVKDLLLKIPALKWGQAWKNCAGPALLKQAQFHGCTLEGFTRVLKISVPDPVWRQELEYQKNQILSRYVDCLKELGVEENEIPTKIILTANSPVPFKSWNSQTGGNKTRVK